ncbi:MAG: hypothetical protein QOK11_2055 [Pseudonocardiales bacterium]|jgi:hypothetical protein|nr:hypothetical protein [Pseudonocardiales bacterium]MDT4947138.1 hypothetical protein [Pseudonocardiales bacterium]
MSLDHLAPSHLLLTAAAAQRDAENQRTARTRLIRLVAGKARDANDAKLLFAILGLDPREARTSR